MRAARTVCFLALLLATLASAAAEDLWSGIYAGGSIGRRDTDTSWETTCLQPGFAFGSCPHSGIIYADRFAAGNPALFEVERLRLSGYGGLQWQFGRLVVGVEGDLGRAHSRQTRYGIPGAEDPADPVPGPDEITLAYRWDASLRGRIGLLAAPETVIYATAGRAWLKAEASVLCAVEFPDGWCGSDNVGKSSFVEDVLDGRTWGGGIETMLLEHWMLRLEFRHTSYESLEHTFFNGVVRNVDAVETSIGSETDTATLGLAYKF
jgi:outer membrane immunogenic protein